MIIDASNLIIGRMATVAAKKALMGEKIDIVNCENSYISGEKYAVIDSYRAKRRRGSRAKGPFFPRWPDRIVKRTIRGMLPYKTYRGRKAMERVKCYIGIPKGIDAGKLTTIEEADISKLPNLKYVQLKVVCKQLGARL